MCAVDVVGVHARAPSNVGARVAGGDNNAPVESLVMATVGDMLVGGDDVVRDNVATTGGDDKTLEESRGVAIVGDTNVGGDVVVGVAVVATGGDNKVPGAYLVAVA